MKELTKEPKESPKYRAYFIGNMYLSSIQQGIQAAHVLQEMHNKYFFMSSGAAHALFEWGRNDKTIILLNGGYASALQELYENLLFWSFNGTEFPVAKFHEEHDALNGALTSVGIILPESVYGIKYDLEDEYELSREFIESTGFDFKENRHWCIARAIKSLRLAS